MKKTLSLLLVLAMVLSSFGFAFAAEDEVVPAEFLNEKGILKGNTSSGDLMLEDNLKRQDMIIMLSRLLGVEEEAKAYEGETTFTDIADPFYVPYIAWAEAEELTKGKAEGKFGFDEFVTEQQVAQFMLRALGYGEVAWDEVPAKAVELGLVEKDADLTVDAKRSVLAEITYKALGMKMKDSEKTLAEELEIEMPVPAEATTVDSASATNLKEIVVKFDGEVDKASAEIKDNYSLDDGEIVSAVLSEDLTEVLLTVKEGMAQQKERELTVRNIKAGENKINATAKFTPIDKELPEVDSVDALGNKAVKVTFSEPVKDNTIAINSFKVDGKSLSGTVDKNNSRVVIVKFYTKLADGSHKLTVSGVEDFAGYKIIANEYEFEVVEDKDAPTIESTDATLEYVTVKFSEPVQPNTVRGGSYAYWKGSEATTVKNASAIKVEKLADDTYVFDFTGKPLPGYPVYLYIEGVKDYSDNTIAKDTPVLVEAKIDQTRPEVVYVELDDDNKNIEVKFTKAIANFNDKSKYTLLDEDGKAVSIRKATSTDGKVVTVELFSALGEGVYTFKMQGLTDKTALKNAIMPYDTTLEVGDITKPDVTGVSVEGRHIYIYFDKEMAVDVEEGVTNLNNYFIKYNGKQRSLPAGTTVEVFANGKTVLLTLPAKIDNEETVASKLQSVTIQRVEDTAGNQLKNYSKTVESNTFENDFKATKAVLKDENTIVVTFNQVIGTTVLDSHFVLTGASIDKVDVVNNTVTLNLNEDVYDASTLTLKVVGNSFESVIGKKVVELTFSNTDPVNKIADKVAPQVNVKETEELSFATTGTVILVPVTEKIETSQVTLAASELRIERNDGELLKVTDHYTVAVNTDPGKDNELLITLTEDAYKDGEKAINCSFVVKLQSSIYVKGADGNAIELFERSTKDLNKADEAQAAVDAAKAALLANNLIISDSTLTLPGKSDDVTITWAVSTAEELVASGENYTYTIIRPTGDIAVNYVTFTATLAKDGASATKAFKVSIPQTGDITVAVVE